MGKKTHLRPVPNATSIPFSLDVYDRPAIIKNIHGVDYDLVVEVVNKTHNSLLKSVRMDCWEDCRRALLFLTQTGHAANAHREYAKVQNKEQNIVIDDFTVEDVCDAWIAKNPHRKIHDKAQRIKFENQRRIDEIAELFDRYADGERITKLTTMRKTPNGKEVEVPLCENKFFMREDAQFDPSYFEFVIKGFILGGLMDTYDWRYEASQYFDSHQKPMGGGSCVAIDLQKLYEHRLKSDYRPTPYSIDHLANNAITIPAREDYIEKGIIRLDDAVVADRRFISGYVREKLGPGGCDDASILATGLLYYDLTEDVTAAMCVAFGVYLADHIDTTDKFVPNIRSKGQDEYLAEKIRERYPHAVTDKQILRHIYGAAKSTFPDADPKLPHHWSSSSQRYFMQKDTATKTSWISRIFQRIMSPEDDIVLNNNDRPFFTRVDTKLRTIKRKFKGVGY